MLKHKRSQRHIIKQKKKNCRIIHIIFLKKNPLEARIHVLQTVTRAPRGEEIAARRKGDVSMDYFEGIIIVMN